MTVVFYLVLHLKNYLQKSKLTIALAIILAFVDLNAFGECFSGNLSGFPFILNLMVTVMMLVQTVATIFSGYDYVKDGKELLKD